MMSQEGYWEPHTSSIEFCEPNYYVTPFIAEPHNAWSSVFIFVIAILGYFYGNPLGELRVSLMFIALALVGIGSTALHSTLHWIWQSSDEVPMLWQALSMLYFLLEIRKEVGSKQSARNLFYFSCVCFVQTIIYFFFQQMFVVFFISVTIYAILIASSITFLAFEGTDCHDRQLLLRLAITSYAIVGAVLWIVDMTYCEFLLPFYLGSGFGGMTFHVLWHIGAGLGTYFAITFLVLVRLQTLKKDAQLKWIQNFLPICTIQ